MAELNIQKGWNPSEGHRRAEFVVQELERDGVSTGHRFSPEYRWRMVAVIAGAIDQALRDGSEQDALHSMIGNGMNTADDVNVHSPYRVTSPEASAILETEGMVPRGTTAELIIDNAAIEGRVKRRGRKPGRRRRGEDAAP